MTRPFRFGVVAPLTTDVPTWRDRVRRIAGSGYSTLLVPDFPLTQPAPGPMLATAAALTDLRVGTWVYASPLRPPWQTAWEAHSLSLLTEGRFEMGIGTGRPGIEDELRDKGLPVLPPSERLAEVRETVKALRDLDGPDRHTPVAMAVLGPKARALAAEVADTVTFALGTSLEVRSNAWPATSAPPAISSSHSPCPWSAIPSRRIWHPRHRPGRLARGGRAERTPG